MLFAKAADLIRIIFRLTPRSLDHLLSIFLFCCKLCLLYTIPLPPISFILSSIRSETDRCFSKDMLADRDELSGTDESQRGIY